jgi:flavin-dependent dehydrogenase
MTAGHEFDVAIIGGGPAASAAAISARQCGLRSIVIARQVRRGDQFGESLSPAAAATLHQLDLPPRFLDEEHRPCVGNASAWGSAELQRYDFIRDPRGHGWHIDRARFESRLREQALRAGAEWRVTCNPLGVRAMDGGGWCLSSAVTAKITIDATGRAASFARRQGERRIDVDRQVGWVTFFASDDPPPADTTSWIEAVEHGWWYSAIMPSGRMVIVLFTDADLQGAEAASVDASIAGTMHMRRRVALGGYRPIGPPRRVAAGGGRLSGFAGKDWLAAGDAAMVFDPLSGHGLTVALQSGRDAALAATGMLRGDASAGERYQSMLAAAYERYASMRRMYYLLEGRWPGAPYWRRRREAGNGPWGLMQQGK